MDQQIITVSNISKKYKRITDRIKYDTFAEVMLCYIKNILKNEKVSDSKESEFWALKDITFTVNKGDRIGIIGHNGAGKSTLLKIFSRITVPSEGEIEVHGRVSSLLEVGTGFHQELTGRENIYLNGAILGMTRAEIEGKFNDIVEFSEIGDFLDTPVKRYSSGMYVRLAFAVAAHLDPDILIVDEVLAVGDMKFQQKCLGKMENVSGEGRTILYVSHNMTTVQQLCNRVIVMDHGKIIFDGNVDDGIKIYMNNTKESMLFNDLSQIVRKENKMNGYVKMLSLEILDKDECLYDSSEVMKFKIKWKAFRNLEDVCMRMIILYADGSPAGMMTTKPVMNAEKNQTVETTFHADTRFLAPGKYLVQIEVYSVNEYGTFEHLDVVQRAFSFEIIQKQNESNNMDWLHRWWGHVRLPEIQICD